MSKRVSLFIASLLLISTVAASLFVFDVFKVREFVLQRLSLKEKTVSELDALKIFQDATSHKPNFLKSISLNGENTIIGSHEMNPASSLSTILVIHVFQKYAQKWIEKNQFEYGNDGKMMETIDKPELVEINGKSKIYFLAKRNEIGLGFAGFSDLEFNLYDPTENAIRTLTYSGQDVDDKRIEGKFNNLSEFENDDGIARFFEQKVQSNQIIYRPNANDLNLDLARNFEKKWKLDNADINWEPYGRSRKIMVRKYSEKLIPDIEGTIYKKIENNRYIIYSVFKSNVIAYEKFSKKYFPVVVQGCNAGDCTFRIDFIDQKTISMQEGDYSGSPFVTLNLETMLYESN